MLGEGLAVPYRPSQPYHPVNLEGGLLRDMPTPPSGQIRPNPTQPNPCQVPPRTPKRSSFRSCVSPESTSAAGGQVGHVPQPAVFGVLFPRDVARRARTRRIPYARGL